MAKSGNTEVEHIIKQRKRKNLPNTMIYGSQNKVVEMHELKNYEIDNKPLGEILKQLNQNDIDVNERLDKAKEVIKLLSEKIEKIERKLISYGLK